jgi:hypothetical protein
MSFGGPQCYARAPPSRVACRGRHRAEGCRTLDILADNDLPGHRHREQEYGYLSYYHHVVLDFQEVDSLVHIVTEELGTRGFTTPFFPASR